METFARFYVQQEALCGALHLPEAEAPAQGWPSAVILHGFQSDRCGPHRLLTLCSRQLARRGIASLRFDFRGSGDSGGDFSQATISGQVQDALAAAEYLRRQPHIDPQRVMLLGFSLGGMVAALAASRCGHRRCPSFSCRCCAADTCRQLSWMRAAGRWDAPF